MNERKVFSKKELALSHAQEIGKQLVKFGAQTDVPKEKVILAERYQQLAEQLSSFGQTPEDAVKHYRIHLSNEVIKQVKPFVRDLAEKWKSYKYEDSTLSRKNISLRSLITRFLIVPKRVHDDS